MLEVTAPVQKSLTLIAQAHQFILKFKEIIKFFSTVNSIKEPITHPLNEKSMPTLPVQSLTLRVADRQVAALAARQENVKPQTFY